LPTNLESGFKMTPRQLSEAAKKGAKALLLNYPANPTGASYTKGELQELSKTIIKYKLLVISDEIYDELTYDFDHTPLATIKGMKRHVVYLNGFSKSFAMTGFRIGWACGPAEIIAGMTKIHQYTMLCASIVGQMAALEALRNGFKDIVEMKKEYIRRRRFMVESLNGIGLTCHNPEGAFYVFPSIRSTRQKALDFARDLLRKERVAVVPGVAFGPSAEGFVRMSYASGYENLKEAVSRIRNYLRKA
jgi:aminotransferase